jgi:hypothetical protein
VSSFSSSLHLIKSTLTHLRKNCCYLQWSSYFSY